MKYYFYGYRIWLENRRIWISDLTFLKDNSYNPNYDKYIYDSRKKLIKKFNRK